MIHASPKQSFLTTSGTGPDKWASIWVIQRYLEPSNIRIVPTPPDNLQSSISFDYPGSEFNRTGSTSTLSALIEQFDINSPNVQHLTSLITEIEFEPWKVEKSVESILLEQGFRNMQIKFGRTTVSYDCYMAFFDNFMAVTNQNALNTNYDPNNLIPKQNCTDSTSVQPESVNTRVPEISQHDVLTKLARNKKILFIDTRENKEFAEGHIPASINLKLREVNESSALRLPSADIVVAYCVKDFRGYETARKLRRYGINAVIMKPYGIKGWIDADLPIVGPRGTNEEDALLALENKLIHYR